MNLMSWAVVGVVASVIAVGSAARGVEISPAESAARRTLLARLADMAIVEDDVVADAAIAELRAAGPAGLAALLALLPAIEQENAALETLASTVVPEPRLRRAIDAVAAQRDAYASRLYWYTDIGTASSVAAETNRPILVLHLLGQLSEDLSCANSRFFRQVLYSDPRISRLLCEKFVLFWYTTRPAPKLTIDFGDGRQLVRTITGNSLHYVLDSQGRLIDTLPGMYEPVRFLESLERAAELARRSVDLEAGTRHEALAEYHRLEIDRLTEELAEAIARLEGEEAKTAGHVLLARTVSTADEAVQDSTWWEQLAAADPTVVELHPASEQFLRRQLLQAGLANRLAMTKAITESPLLRAIAGFTRTLHADTLRNELVMHRMLHDWLLASAPANFSELVNFNERVYSELFLAPLSDPWAGLHDPAAYTALEENGMVPYAE
ncbi:MAG: thioredoxin family protein [Pirellulales bacterium]|nr:thioredoxin family protein [Pirellulales bacterium]